MEKLDDVGIEAEAQIDAEAKPGDCAHACSHVVKEGSDQRECRDCGKTVTVREPSARQMELDRVVRLLSCGQGTDFVEQVREMVDTRTDEQLRLLVLVR